MGPPPSKGPLTAARLREGVGRVPCATVLVRVLPLGGGRGGDTVQEARDFTPLYHDRAYDSTQCVPSQPERPAYR
jgi:hypothetical protein